MLCVFLEQNQKHEPSLKDGQVFLREFSGELKCQAYWSLRLYCQKTSVLIHLSCLLSIIMIHASHVFLWKGN